MTPPLDDTRPTVESQLAPVAASYPCYYVVTDGGDVARITQFRTPFGASYDAGMQWDQRDDALHGLAEAAQVGGIATDAYNGQRFFLRLTGVMSVRHFQSLEDEQLLHARHAARIVLLQQPDAGQSPFPAPWTPD